MNRRQKPNLPTLAPALPTNAALSQLLEAGAGDPNMDRLPLLRELQTAQLLIPILQAPGKVGAGRAHNIKMAVLETSGGRALAGFTNVDAYRRFAPTQKLAHAAIPAVELCRFARQGQFRAVVLNPGGPYGYEMSPIEFQMVAERLLPDVDGGLRVAPNTPAQIGMPAQRPADETLQAFRAIAQDAGAAEAYWFWLAIAGGVAHLGLGIAPADPVLIRAIGEAINPIWKEARPDNPLLDILPLEEDETSRIIRDKGECLLPLTKQIPDVPSGD